MILNRHFRLQRWYLYYFNYLFDGDLFLNIIDRICPASICMRVAD